MGHNTVLGHVIASAQKATSYILRQMGGNGPQVALLVPKGDPLYEEYRSKIKVFEGDEQDVLSRYVDAAKATKADLVMRITGDCVFMPAFMISRAIKTALRTRADYITNVVYRTAPEGWDVEIMTARLLTWLDENAKGGDREHVTTLIRREIEKFPFREQGKPNICHMFENMDLSGMKTSIDTEQDYAQAQMLFTSLDRKISLAKKNGTFAR